MPQKISWWVYGVLALFSAMPASALTINPGRTQAELSPGGTMEAVLVATNDDPETIHVELSSKDWFVLEANKENQLGVNTWLKILGKQKFDLKPKETREVKIALKCPEKAQGELVGMVSFLYRTDNPSMMTPVISVSVYLGALGTEKVSGEIEQVVVQKWNNAIQAVVDVKSTGNVHLRPMGIFIFEDKNGNEIARFSTKEGGPAYPGRNQGYFAQVPAEFKLERGRYRVRAELEYRGVILQERREFNVLKDGSIEMQTKPKAITG